MLKAFLQRSSVLVLGILIVGCTSSPSKKPTTPSVPWQQQQLSKTLPIPVDGVKKAELRDTWGASRSQGRRHEGIDIFAPRGSKVYSTTDGLVADLRDNTLGGKVVWIKGPSQSWHYYAHLNAHHAQLKVGDVVQRGQVIGYVGNTGNAKATPPHLHYGIYLLGKGRGATNPYPYLR